jgi:hypothetical protein
MHPLHALTALYTSLKYYAELALEVVYPFGIFEVALMWVAAVISFALGAFLAIRVVETLSCRRRARRRYTDLTYEGYLIPVLVVLDHGKFLSELSAEVEETSLDTQHLVPHPHCYQHLV